MGRQEFSQGGVKPYFHTLSGMRGIAALFVVAYHFSFYMTPFRDPLGFAAVDLFFLLSGAVIEASYGAKLRLGMTLGAFFRIRTIRLYPLYILGPVIMLVAIAVAPRHILFIDPAIHFTLPHPLTLFAASVFFVATWNIGTMFPLDPPAWSLFWELVANMLYVALTPRLSRRVLLGIVFASAAVMVGVAVFGNIHNDLAGAPRVGFSFFLGVLMFREIGAWRAPAWASWVALGIVCAVLASPKDGTATYLCAVLVAFPAAVWLALRAQPPVWTVRASNVLGDLSYPLYTIHVPFAALVLAITGPIGGAPWSGWAFLAGLAAVSWALDQWFDRPVRRFLSALRIKPVSHSIGVNGVLNADGASTRPIE